MSLRDWVLVVRDCFAALEVGCVAAVAVWMAPVTQAAGLNDTGQTQCFDAANAPVHCSVIVGGDFGVNPRQDARYGRDAAAASGQLSKVGAGGAGFDYTKISNDGRTLAAGTTLGAGAGDWACTRDNVSGLVWEVKTAAGLRSIAHTYTWYSTDATTNGGNNGSVGGNSCGGSLAAAPYNNACNTQNFIAAVNALSGGLCGANDWRLPTRRELLTLVHAGNSDSSIDAAYFPNTSISYYLTMTTFVSDPTYAWAVSFGFGDITAYYKSYVGGARVRLVRSVP